VQRDYVYGPRGLRAVDWRYQIAVDALRRKRQPDGPDVLILRVWRRLRREANGRPLDPCHPVDAAILAARSPCRKVVEALLLAASSFERIGELTALPPPVVELFSLLFFDVVGLLDCWAYIRCWALDARSLDFWDLVKSAGFQFGELAVSVIIDRGPVDPDVAAEIDRWIRYMVLRRAVLAATLPVKGKAAAAARQATNAWLALCREEHRKDPDGTSEREHQEEVAALLATVEYVLANYPSDSEPPADKTSEAVGHRPEDPGADAAVNQLSTLGGSHRE